MVVNGAGDKIFQLKVKTVVKEVVSVAYVMIWGSKFEGEIYEDTVEIAFRSRAR